VCEERLVEVAFQPCGHIAVCTKCCDDLVSSGRTDCIVCRKPWSTYVRTFMC
jgi:hypothetical protein